MPEELDWYDLDDGDETMDSDVRTDATWVDGSGSGPGGRSGSEPTDDLPPGGRVPRGVWAAGAAALVLVAALHFAGGNNTVAHDRSSGLVGVEDDTTSTPRPPLPGPADEVLDLARSQGPLTDIVRTTAQKGACPSIAVGARPITQIDRALKASLPGYASVDSSRIIDQDAGLCAMRVRAHDGLGTTVVLFVTAPDKPLKKPQTPRIATGFQINGVDSTTYVTATTTMGWQVQVGAAGTVKDLPQSRDLLTLAQDARLIW